MRYIARQRQLPVTPVEILTVTATAIGELSGKLRGSLNYIERGFVALKLEETTHSPKCRYTTTASMPKGDFQQTIPLARNYPKAGGLPPDKA